MPRKLETNPGLPCEISISALAVAYHGPVQGIITQITTDVTPAASFSRRISRLLRRARRSGSRTSCNSRRRPRWPHQRLGERESSHARLEKRLELVCTSDELGIGAVVSPTVGKYEGDIRGKLVAAEVALWARPLA